MRYVDPYYLHSTDFLLYMKHIDRFYTSFMKVTVMYVILMVSNNFQQVWLYASPKKVSYDLNVNLCSIKGFSKVFVVFSHIYNTYF